MVRLVRTFVGPGILTAVALHGCAGPQLIPGPQVVVEMPDGREITVVCLTDVEFASGECGGWAHSVLDGDPDNVIDLTGVTRIVLSGSIRPGPDQDRCNADLHDAIGRSLRTVPVRCHVPSGG